MSARFVCNDLGYLDGRSICCSAYNDQSWFLPPKILSNVTLECFGSEKNISGCIKTNECKSGLYASAVCFDNEAQTTDNGKKIL